METYANSNNRDFLAYQNILSKAEGTIQDVWNLLTIS